jgi:3',5'-cyclic AMP phosphodiesterase CpdA
MLRPLLDTVPSLVIPGNHDAYAADTVRGDWMNKYFGQWRHMDGSIGRLVEGSVTVLGLDPNRPQWLLANGEIPEEQLADLERVLNGPDLTQHVVLTLHYPVVDKTGRVYDGKKHGLLNARHLIDVLSRVRRKPDMVLHGHIHHGYRSRIDLGTGSVTTYDCGASGYAYMPELRRCASMNLYTFREDGSSHRVDRYQYNGETFAPEQGGAYATGR